MNTHLDDYQALMLAARDPQDITTLAMAGVFSMKAYRKRPYDIPIFGLGREKQLSLLQWHFPHLRSTSAWSDFPKKTHDPVDEFDDLVELLLRNRTVEDEPSAWLAHAVATASMADNHLWQDMGLPGRTVLSQLLHQYFAPLASRNVNDMKWKKFFYRQLCEQAGLKLCRSPSCGVCHDYVKCFGPEEMTADHLRWRT